MIVTILNIIFSAILIPKSPSSSSSISPYLRPFLPKYPSGSSTIPSSTPRYPYFPKFPSFPKFKASSSNLRGTMEKSLEINLDYFLDKEIETPKELRNLSYDGIKDAILYVNIGTFLFIIILFFSFLVTKNEFCHDYPDDNSVCAAGCCCVGCMCCVDGDCSICFGVHSGGNGNNSGAAALALIILILFFLLFKLIKCCGKQASRLVALIFLLLVNITVTALSFYSGTTTYHVLIAVFSIFSAICNLLGMILPNCSGCEKLSYDYIPPIDDQINEVNSTPQQLLEVEPQKEMPPINEAYPNSEEIVQNPIQQNTPNYTDTNPGYDNNRYSVNSLDAPAPIYTVQENDYNNQEDMSYPKPQ